VPAAVKITDDIGQPYYPAYLSDDRWPRLPSLVGAKGPFDRAIRCLGARDARTPS
jgi:hypothetical protein